MGKQFKKWVLRILVFVVSILLLGILASPYRKHKGQTYRSVQYTLEINAPVDSVFQFMGNSAMASKWSVYVDQIRTLNRDEFPDGTVGSIRRCFVHPLKNDQQWDEEITSVEKNKRRRLRVYNLVKFPMMAEGLLTEQVYEKVDENKTKLTLSLFFESDEPAAMDWFKTKLGAYEIKRIFKENLKNIKTLLENKNHD